MARPLHQQRGGNARCGQHAGGHHEHIGEVWSISGGDIEPHLCHVHPNPHANGHPVPNIDADRHGITDADADADAHRYIVPHR